MKSVITLFTRSKEGVVLDLSYEINLVRQAHKSLKKWKLEEVSYVATRVQPDIHNGVEVTGNNSQDDRDKGDWEETSDKSEAEGGNESCCSDVVVNFCLRCSVLTFFFFFARARTLVLVLLG